MAPKLSVSLSIYIFTKMAPKIDPSYILEKIESKISNPLLF